MGVLNKPYEISLWEDVYNNTTNELEEKKICIIGTNLMTSQSRAINPKLTSNINGSNTFTFSIYYYYKDNITGEQISNPFAQYLTNERKVKLFYDNSWYHFIIKSVKIDSSKYSYEVTATDQYINELSRNGFNLTFDAESHNNLGSIQTLAQATLADTDWSVPDAGINNSEFILDVAKETLVKFILLNDTDAIQIKEQEGLEPTTASQTILANEIIYGFYSCCKDKTNRFQFIYIPSGTDVTLDDERVITNKNCQYYIDGITYTDNSGFGIGVPTIATFQNIESIYRGGRYVYSADTQYNSVIGQYVTVYSKDVEGTLTNYLGYTTTEYKAPNLIQNWVTNSNTFKSTAGWRTGVLSGSDATMIKGKIEVIAVCERDNQEYTLMSDLMTGAYVGQTYTSKIKYTATQSDPAIILANSGFYDNRTAINNLVNGKKYVVYLKANRNLRDITVTLGQYATSGSTYTLQGSPYFTSSFDTDGAEQSLIVQIDNSVFTPNSWRRQIYKTLLVLGNLPVDIEIEDFQVFEYIPKIGGYVRPEDQLAEAKVITTYHLYNTGLDPTKTLDEYAPIYEGTSSFTSLGYSVVLSCEKKRSITVKESNFFNIIQTLCENFECWAEFKIATDGEGIITGKQVIFHNYVGKDNYAGFRYGINLKSIQRTDDSKQIVTKLIVKQNANEFGKNGFCTITRAGSNETGENYIYNVDYYINHGLLAAADWNKAIYDTTNASGKDINLSDTTWNSNGYYVRLRRLNNTLEDISNNLTNQRVVLAKAQSDLTIYETGYSAASASLEDAEDDFERMFGIPYTNIQNASEDVKNKITKNQSYLIKIAEYYQAKKDYNKKIGDDQSGQKKYVNDLQLAYDALDINLNLQISYKNQLNKAFYSDFYRYIQEGTWQSEDYYDDEKYYLDALATTYNSSMPKVSYNISVLELSQLQEYRDFKATIGDQTYIEDPEFFGYDEEGAPIREKVVLTEISYNLDQPEKNSIKIQTYKSSFQDLFKKITATVQSVQYSAGSYDRAAQLVEADDKTKSKFLEGALNDAGTILQNSANQTVRLDAEGLTITDGSETNKLLRAVSGGILLSSDGGNTWDMGITNDGVSAKILTSGVLNTGIVNIMNGSEPTFKWDSYGLTAYNFDNIQNPTPDYTQGVRFDRLGIYGFSGVGADWKPTDIAEWYINANNNLVLKSDTATTIYTRHHSMFELTAQGLYLDLGKGKNSYSFILQKNSATPDTYSFVKLATPLQFNYGAQLGKIEDVIYNKWDKSQPYYESDASAQAFVKIMNATVDNIENFALYTDGTIRAKTLYLSDGIQFDDGSGLIKRIYCTQNIAVPVDGTAYADIPDDSSNNWHRTFTTNDQYYADSIINGHWNGPIPIADKISIVTKYCTTNSTTPPATSYSDWSIEYPQNITSAAPYIHTWRHITSTFGSIWDEFTYVKYEGPRQNFDIYSDTYWVKFNKQGARQTTTINLSAQIDTLSGYTWKYRKQQINGTWDSTWTTITGSTGSTCQLNNTFIASIFDSINPKYQQIQIECSATMESILVKDYLCIARNEDGEDSFNVISNNPHFTFTGTSDYKTKLQSETLLFEVVKGDTEFTYQNSEEPVAPMVGYYTITLPTNLTYLTFVKNNQGIVTINTIENQTAADGNATITIKANINGTIEEKDLSITWNFSYDGADGADGQPGAKGDKGDPGVQGARGISTEVLDIYYRYNTFGIPTTPSSRVTATTEVDQQWTTYPLMNGTSTNKYVYFCQQTIITDESQSPTSITITCTHPNLIKAFHDSNNTVPQETYANYLVLSKGETTNGLYYDTNGHLSINATYIKSGVVDADLIDVNNLYVKHLDGADGNFTGTLSASCITSGTIAAARIDVNSLYVKHLDGADGTFNGIMTVGTGPNYTFKADATNGTIQINTSGFSLTNGNAYFSGALMAASGTFNGSITVGSDSDPTFKVDASGGSPTLIINTTGFQLDNSGNATFKGSLQGASGTFAGNLSASSTKFKQLALVTNMGTTSEITQGIISAYTGSGSSGGIEIYSNNESLHLFFTNNLAGLVYNNNGFYVSSSGMECRINGNTVISGTLDSSQGSAPVLHIGNTTASTGRVEIESALLIKHNVTVDGNLIFDDINYGTTEPTGTGTNGQIYFQIIS